MLTAKPEPKGANAATDKWSRFRKDLIAGLTVAAIAVPQAMAYALIAGIDPRFGLYTAIVMTALGSIFGSSSHLINGPTNAISLVVFSAIALVHTNAKDQAYEAVFLLTMMVGTIQIAIALFKLGDLTRYISESVVLGFMAGAGCLIALSQVGNLLGLQEQGTGHHHLLYRLWLTLTEGGPINFRALFIGVLTVVLVVSLRHVTRKYRLPRVDMLLALAAAAGLAASAGWSIGDSDGKASIAVVGSIPPGLPDFHFPLIKMPWVREMAGSAAAIALLGLLEAVAIAKTIAIQTREVLDLNRQCLAEGLANFFGGMFRCMPGSGSLTRSAINFQAGAVSRWSGVFAAGAVALVVVLLAPLAHTIPRASLGGILLVTAAGLLDRKRLSYALRASRYDASLVLVTAGAALFVSVEFSILIGTALSILLYVPRAARLQATELAMGPDRVIRDRLATDPPCNRLVLFDLEGELFFGAAPDLDRCLEGLKRKLKEGPRIVVLRLKRTRNPDVVCMERLEQFLKEMQGQKVTILLCGVRTDFFQAMNNLRFQDWLPADCVFVEDSPGDSSTLAAVRRAYELLAGDVCQSCPRRGESKTEREPLYYMI